LKRNLSSSKTQKEKGKKEAVVKGELKRVIGGALKNHYRRWKSRHGGTNRRKFKKNKKGRSLPPAAAGTKRVEKSQNVNEGKRKRGGEKKKTKGIKGRNCCTQVLVGKKLSREQDEGRGEGAKDQG